MRLQEERGRDPGGVCDEGWSTGAPLEPAAAAPLHGASGPLSEG